MTDKTDIDPAVVAARDIHKSLQQAIVEHPIDGFESDAIPRIRTAYAETQAAADAREQRLADAPLSVEHEGNDLVIRIGIDHLNGHDCHETLPELKIIDREQWVKDIIYEIAGEDESGASPIGNLFDRSMVEALENGSLGVAEDSPTHIGSCERCDTDCVPLIHTAKGQLCTPCQALLHEKG
jgi:hypothetical protein